jgi:RimJ/RimL family protein N-acetyltransferase
MTAAGGSGPVLQSARLVMHPLAEPDFPAFHALLTEPGVRRYLCDDRILPEDETRGFLERSRALFAEERAGLWGIRTSPDGELLGIVGFWYFHALHAASSYARCRNVCGGAVTLPRPPRA